MAFRRGRDGTGGPTPAVARRILIIVGHPDPNPSRLCRALAAAYAGGAEKAGHSVRQIDIATLELPMLRTKEEFEHGSVPEVLKPSTEAIVWVGHIVLVYPLWLGTMPAMLKAFLEQVLPPGTAIAYPEAAGALGRSLLGGRSARIVVTMGMPEAVYGLWFRDHGLAGMRHNILNFVGIAPVRETLFGMVASGNDMKRARWLERMPRLGEAAGWPSPVSSGDQNRSTAEPAGAKVRERCIGLFEPIGRVCVRPPPGARSERTPRRRDG